MRRCAVACLNLMAREMTGGLADNMDQWVLTLELIWIPCSISLLRK